MELSKRVDALLDFVQKPAQYSGGEMNISVKPWEAADVRFAFCFPDVYEVGMSHLGMKILYEIINRRPDSLCERVFAPWVDMADLMKAQSVPLFSLESRRPVRAYDVVGFTLQYELSYTTVLEILSLSMIPIFSKDRTAEDPIVIAGGPCAFNPEPLHAFVDAFVIGDGEECIHQIIESIKQSKALKEGREETLLRLSGIQGVYVPSFYQAVYQEDGTLQSFSATLPNSNRVAKRIVKDLDHADYPESLVVPYVEIVHDRIMLEIMRGCTRGCRFCQAGMLYRPVRERSVDTLCALAEKLVDATGYEEMSLSSLSTGDYSHLPELSKALHNQLKEKRISLSLPSMRSDSDLSESFSSLEKNRRSSLTFAPEAGTQRLRDVINKGITEENILQSVRDAFAHGTHSVKLYFMIGLPTETEQDVLAIADLVFAIIKEFRQVQKGYKTPGLHVSVSVSSFVPKPFTPFQWAAQEPMQVLRQKQTLLRDALRPFKGVVLHWHDPEVSLIEACFARGDRKLSDVLFTAWQKGCRLDGWTEHFHFQTWMDAFEACGIDPAWYANRKRLEEEILPWDFIDAGVTKAYLLHEKHRSESGLTTPDCRMACNACGLMEVCNS